MPSILDCFIEGHHSVPDLADLWRGRQVVTLVLPLLYETPCTAGAFLSFDKVCGGVHADDYPANPREK